MLWKENWDEVREHFAGWWRREDCVVWLTAPADRPRGEFPAPPPAESLEQQWLDPSWRRRRELHRMAHTFFAGDAFPLFNVNIGPGSLGTFLGCQPELRPTTVWYHPTITTPEAAPPIRFDETNEWWQRHLAVIDAGLEVTDGRYLVGMPDLIENMDTLAALRGTLEVLSDLTDRPQWVQDCLWGINDAFFAAFDRLYARLRDEHGGNAFCAFQLYGPGKTAKVQCDIAALMGPDHFGEFVVPPLRAQCEWLDYSMFHLDGSQCIVHLDHLLAIDALDAIEFTPEPGQPRGGDPHWYDLYRRILDAGKGVQAVGVHPDEVLPLLEATGHRGMFLMAGGLPDESSARELTRQVDSIRKG